MANTRWVANVAALQAESGMLEGEVAALAGYYVAGDGGGGLLYFVSLIPNTRKVVGTVAGIGSPAPVKITTAFDHGLSNGQRVMVAGIGGVPDANGTRTISVVDNTNFTLDGSVFSGSYSGGGAIGDGGQSIPSGSTTTGYWRRVPGDDPMAGVVRDAVSLKYTPASASEWTTTLAVAGIATGNPSALWLLQEASGNAADSIGTFPLTATGTLNYQQSAAWERKSIRVATDGSTGSLTTTAASIPNISSTSLLVLAYIDMPTAAPAAVRNLIGFGTAATRAAAEYSTGSKVQGRSGANVTIGTAVPTSVVRPVVCKVDRTNNAVAVYTDQEKIVPTFDTGMSGQGISLFKHAVGSGQNAALCGVLYAAAFFSSAAQLSDVQVKSLLQTLGWAVQW